MTILVHIVIGQLDFMEGDIVFHPVTSGGWAVWMVIQSRSELGLRLAGHCPLLARVLVSALLRQHDVQQHEVVLGGLQAGHGGPDGGEHAPE